MPPLLDLLQDACDIVQVIHPQADHLVLARGVGSLAHDLQRVRPRIKHRLEGIDHRLPFRALCAGHSGQPYNM